MTPDEYNHFISTIAKAAFGLGQVSPLATEIRAAVAELESQRHLSAEWKTELGKFRSFLDWYRDSLKIVRLTDDQVAS